MKKVIIERPRTKSIAIPRRQLHWRRMLRDQEDLDDCDGGRSRVGVSRAVDEEAGWSRKRQTDLLGPMLRLLRKNVGRPWNDVWSEICASTRDFMGDHLRRHVLDHVLRPTVGRDGKLVDRRGRALASIWYDTFYVDPATGRLCVAPRERRRRLRKATQTVFECDGCLFHRHEGIWYRVEMATCPKESPFHDAFLHEITDDRELLLAKYGRNPQHRAWYCVRKSSACHREIARLMKRYPQLQSEG